MRHFSQTETAPEAVERFTAIVHDEARRMQRLVEDLISLSRIEAERFSTPTDPLELAPLQPAGVDVRMVDRPD